MVPRRALQGMVFSVVGFGAGIVGTATSNLLLALRKRLDPSFQTQNAAPNVLLNAGTWATHMGVSSNVRYQILNGLDMVRMAPSAWCCMAEVFRPSALAVWNDLTAGDAAAAAALRHRRSDCRYIPAGCRVALSAIQDGHVTVCASHALQVMSAQLSPTAFKALTSVLRTFNNVLGGISFVILAKVFGVQSSAGDQRKTTAKALPAAAE